jgi:uncharacterized protein YabN with tetrapyrrole methylase and pyrophosphatase domain
MVEEAVLAKGMVMENLTMVELDRIWDENKHKNHQKK